jgi:transposase
MVKPLSVDLRMRVAAALGDGMTVRAAAQRFGVSVASAVRMGQRARSGEGLSPRSSGGHRQPVLLGVAEAITTRLAAKSDWTVRGLAADLRDDGIEVSHDTVWRFLRRQGLSFKKNAVCQRDGPVEAGPDAGALERLPASS